MQITSEDFSAARAELVEAEFMYQYVSSMPAGPGAVLGCATARIGGGVALSIRDDPTGYWSKALGLGFDEPVTGELIDRILDFYRQQGDRTAVLQIAPSALPPDWEQIRTGRDLQPSGAMVKLAARVEEIRPGGSELRVAPVTEDDAEEWASLITTTFFGAPFDGIVQMAAATVRHPAFHPYAAWDGTEMVAGANLLVNGKVASLNSGATLPGHRGGGAQSALIAARAAAARQAGCRWLVAETGSPGPGSVDQSLNNLRRAGLRPMYVRQNVTWRDGGRP
jgi:GNAT superfamily N-acetyltransferase